MSLFNMKQTNQSKPSPIDALGFAFLATLLTLLIITFNFTGCTKPEVKGPRQYYRVRVFSGGDAIIDRFDCYDYYRDANCNTYTLWTDDGLVKISGTMIIEKLNKAY